MQAKSTVRVADLKPGDKTPWYVVNEIHRSSSTDLIRLSVTFTDTGEPGEVTGAADEEVPRV